MKRKLSKREKELRLVYNFLKEKHPEILEELAKQVLQEIAETTGGKGK